MSTTTTPSGINASMEAITALFGNIEPVSEASQLGRDVTMYGVGTVGAMITMVLAFSCSGFWLGFITFVLVGILMAIISALCILALNYYVSDDKFEALGASLGNAYSTVTGWFTRKAA